MIENLITDKLDAKFNILLKALPSTGNIAWEYNPFRNYRLDEDLYEYDGLYYNLLQLCDKGIYLSCDIHENGSEYEVSNNKNPNLKENLIIISKAFSNDASRKKLIKSIHDAKIMSWIGVPTSNTDPILREAGELVDFITDELEFDLTHPVDILPLDSYDDSVNLILNDGNTYPKLINSRFSPRGRNTYEIVDRKGNSDTNIYDRGELFKTDTSLYKTMNTFPHVKLVRVSNGGQLSVGNYFFYFKLSDSDGNETDFFEQSGLVSIFKGGSNYASISTGEAALNSFKLVTFQLTNLDTSYTYVNVYYSRASSEAGFSRAIDVRFIDLKYLINSSGIANITITGFEPTNQLNENDLNITYSLVDCAKTQVACLNRLFLGNILLPYIDYETLTELSLRFTPEAAVEDYPVNLTNKYTLQTGDKGYADPMYIYSKTGYWNKELYRFGIVYIMKNGSLSPVFDIRGAYNLSEDVKCTEIAYKNNDKVNKIEYDEETYKLINVSNQNPNIMYENVKGVVRMNQSTDTKKVHYFKITTTNEVITELSKYVKGFFFVRQNRIPSILALGITIGIDKQGRVPTIPVEPTLNNYLSNLLSDMTDYTHMSSDDFNGLNYLSEGFMNRYRWQWKQNKNTIWKKVGIIAGMAIAVAAAVVVSIFTFGAATAPVGATLSTVISAGSAALAVTSATGALAVTGYVAAGIIVASVLVATGSTIANASKAAISRLGNKLKYNGWEIETPDGYYAAELTDSRRLENDFDKRIILKDRKSNEVSGIICPEFSVKQSFYNSIFCGTECYIESAISQGPLYERILDDEENYQYRAFNSNGRQFYLNSYEDWDQINHITSKIVALTDNQKSAAIDDNLFHARAGEAEYPWKVVTIGTDHLKNKTNEYASENAENRKINSDYVRGSYGPYLAMEATTTLTPAEKVNIYVPGYDPANYELYVMIRALDYSPYKAITERIDITDLSDYNPSNTALVNDSSNSNTYEFPIYRGDCYLCKYTHRLIRNFNDPETPYNDEIVDPKCWRDGYDPTNASSYDEINSGDVNAVLLGLWITFDVRSTINLNVLTLDESNVSEKAMTGHARGHYPQLPMSTEGTYKIPEASVYNSGMETSVGEKYYFPQPDVPYLKQWYGTRIMYSDIASTDAFKNGYRTFWSTNYKDYPLDYGSITKILNISGYIVCVFEHGVGLIPVNERAAAALSNGGYIYINTENVLPTNPKILSDKIGSQWKDSIIQTPYYIYGVDTVAKKIWRTNGSTFEIISDGTIQSFLNNHITLTERELTPIIGIRNVKSHYNAFKLDVMFTFYDDMYDFEEESWNICFNETLGKWITFYSWIPSFSENIYNVYFSFDRDTSKNIAKLGICNSDSDFADGITLSNNLLSDELDKTKSDDYWIVGELGLKNRNIPTGDGITTTLEFEIIRDVWNNYDDFKIETIDGKLCLLCKRDPSNYKTYLYLRYYVDNNGNKVILDTEKGISEYTGSTSIYKNERGVRVELNETSNTDKMLIFLNLRVNVTITVEDYSKLYAEAYASGYNNLVSMDSGYFQSTIALTHKDNLELLTTDFWKHGQSGIIDIQDSIVPTYWYGKQHPFEFEFVVRENPQLHKIFDLLQIISNNSEPESFHYEVIGDCYNFANDKKNMYIRQEATKELYQYNGSNITYDHDFVNLTEDAKDEYEDIYEKSTILPLYYARQDKIDEIKDTYHSYNSVLESYKKFDNTCDYDYLAGGEIKHNSVTDEYSICNHVKAVDVKSTKENDWTRGNMTYKEDKWDIQINPINFVQLNESIESWKTDENGIKVPVVFELFEPPKDINSDEASLPSDWNGRKQSDEWDNSDYQEAKIKDKYIKIRIRYKGDKLTTILNINTLYTISFS